MMSQNGMTIAMYASKAVMKKLVLSAVVQVVHEFFTIFVISRL